MTEALQAAGLTPLDALRIVLERRGLDAIATLDAPIAPDQRTDGDLVLCELKAFREIDRELLGELVTSLLASLHSKGVDSLLWIRGARRRLRFYLGQLRRAGTASADGRFLQTAAAGFFQGSEIEGIPVRRAEELVAELVRRRH